MSANPTYERMRTESRMKKVREMRAEIRHIEIALSNIEHLVKQSNPDLRALRAAAPPLRGWVASLVESYVVLEHVLSTKQDTTIALGKLQDIIWRTADRYKPAVIEPDPQPYYPDIIDRMG